MSPVAENVIPVPEVVEHFGDVQAVLNRLAVRDAAASLLVDCERALVAPFSFADFGLMSRLQLHSSSLRVALASSGPRGLDLAVSAASRSLARFNTAQALARAAGL